MKKIFLGAALTIFCFALPFAATASPPAAGQIEELHRKADGLIAENDFRGAIDTYLEILFVEPDDEAAYVNMGSCYLIVGDFNRARDAYNNALSIDPDNENAKHGLEKISDPDSARVRS